MFRNRQRRPGSHQVVTGIVRKTAGLTQGAGSAHTEETQEIKKKKNEPDGEHKIKTTL